MGEQKKGIQGRERADTTHHCSQRVLRVALHPAGGEWHETISLPFIFKAEWKAEVNAMKTLSTMERKEQLADEGDAGNIFS